MVVHGPPGTGKSQTIANIIATFLADGKSVLFVSEKTAALDVVKHRLDQKQLGQFCLDLHSERGSKANVYEQLDQSVKDKGKVPKLDFDYAALTERRNRLNRVVRALHEVREPLGRTVYQVQGRYASLRHVPHVQFGVKDIATLDWQRLVAVQEVADRVGLRRTEFREHWTSRWRILKQGTPSLELANKIRHDMKVISDGVEMLASTATRLAEPLGVPAPVTLTEFCQLRDVATHLANAPGVPAHWLQSEVVARLRKTAHEQRELQRAWVHLVKLLTDAFGSPIPDWDFTSFVHQLAVFPEEQDRLRHLLGEEWDQYLLRGGQATSRGFHQVTTGLAQVTSAGEELASVLQLRPPETVTGLEALVSVAATIQEVSPIPTSWLTPQGLEAVTSLLNRAQTLAQELDEREARLFSEYECV